MFRGAPNGGFHDDHRYKMSIKPEPYDGGEDWEEYISHFEICAELGKWHETDKVLALAAALRGPARTFYTCTLYMVIVQCSFRDVAQTVTTC